MNSSEAVARLIAELEDSAIDYMLVGALSCNVYGIPRNTNDADIVVAFGNESVVDFANRLGSDFKLDRQIRLETFTNSLRNVITYLPAGFDIELFRLSDDPHHRIRFERRKRMYLEDIDREAWLPTAEDVIIQKLRWARRKDLDDIVNILSVQGGHLDSEFIAEWASQHDTTELLNQLRNEAIDDDQSEPNDKEEQ